MKRAPCAQRFFSWSWPSWRLSNISSLVTIRTFGTQSPSLAAGSWAAKHSPESIVNSIKDSFKENIPKISEGKREFVSLPKILSGKDIFGEASFSIDTPKWDELIWKERDTTLNAPSSKPASRSSTPGEEKQGDNAYRLDSTKRKRKRAMRKHKHKKRMKETLFERKKLKKL